MNHVILIFCLNFPALKFHTVINKIYKYLD